jgi:2-polyprenyl-3-methyl-5-hydroxy-6-metoxy-1,4-benzoquinol methylase
MDVSHTGFADERFDVVVSFQVIEHLSRPAEFLSEVKRVLRRDGWALIGTPNKRSGNKNPPSPFHLQDWRYDEFMALLNSSLGESQYYGVYLKNEKDARTLGFLDAFIRWDILKIRRLFSSRFRKKVILSLEKTVDLEISKDKPLENALDVIGVYRKT